ncbi:MAG: CsgG/HfaB family protein [Bacteriovoracaceae bacterium]
MRALLQIIFILGILVSCSSAPIMRNHDGTGVRPQSLTDYPVIRKKMALLPLFNEAPYGHDDLGIVATESLRSELVRTGEFVIDQKGEELFGTSKEIFAGGGLKLSQMSKKAKTEGINFVLFGRIVHARVREKSDEIGFVRETKSFTDSKVELRIFDVSSGKEIYNETLLGSADDSNYRFYMNDREEQLTYRQELLRYAVQVAIRKAIPKIVQASAKIDWMGRVAKIVGSKIYINAGRSSGLNMGDVLKVLTEGEDIYDPETGALLGVSKGEVKGTLEIVEYFGPDGCIAVLNSGGSVAEGDFVQLY